MVIQKKTSKKAAVKASNRAVSRKKVRANDEIEEVVDEPEEVEVAPEAADLLFETEDVAELIAEVTGEEVSVTADEESVEFEVGDDVFIVEAEGDEEILESTRKPLRNKKSVKASRKVARKARR